MILAGALTLLVGTAYSQKSDSLHSKEEPKSETKKLKVISETEKIFSMEDLRTWYGQKYLGELPSREADAIRNFVEAIIRQRTSELQKPKP